jgi:hypothetical protein
MEDRPVPHAHPAARNLIQVCRARGPDHCAELASLL